MEISIKNEGTLGIGSIPGRKQKALYRMHGCCIDPIAYFSSEEDAEWVKRFMRELFELANGTIKQF